MAVGDGVGVWMTLVMWRGSWASPQIVDMSRLRGLILD